MSLQFHINTFRNKIYQNKLLIILKITNNSFQTYDLVHKENPTWRNNVSKFYYSIFIWSSTCFGRHIAHHQEPKTALAASGFSYVEGCWTCSWWTLSSTVLYLPRIKKTRDCQCSFRLLMMGGVSPETCWASKKWNNKIWIHCCIFLDFLYELYYDARTHEHQVRFGFKIKVVQH